jgi:hypothetical protein
LGLAGGKGLKFPGGLISGLAKLLGMLGVGKVDTPGEFMTG